MKINKFNDFSPINEKVYIPILDFIVSREGYPLIGDNLTKGKVDFGPGGVALDILNIKGDPEIAGVNKNGDLVVKRENIMQYEFAINGVAHIANCIYYNGEFLEITENHLNEIKNFNIPFDMEVLNYWAIDYKAFNSQNPAIKLDYTPLIPIIPTGWVNVKVDMEVSKRIRRYSEPLGRVNINNPHLKFKSRTFQTGSRDFSETLQGLAKRRNMHFNAHFDARKIVHL